ncbi:hypothetical protein LPJ66_001189 [Kickxella alabastrina]|uniref:Uncharacterized protein n=1 Tax=Kickxella alabastrina TaxID=61397 RepID=A0ACC1ITY9_9FUNG|nr:hypothetical protein LPJ66_001189 [Kickxella alabastrina]
MKFAFAAAVLAATAICVTADNADALSQISAHWDDIVSIINEDLPVLQAAQPAIFAQATAVIGGTQLTAAFNEQLVQHVATGIAPAIMNPVISRAGVTGVTLDGKPLPTAGAVGEDTSTTVDTTAVEESASDIVDTASSEEEQDSTTVDGSEEEEESSDPEEDSLTEDESSEESSTSASGSKSSSSSSGAAKVAAGSLVAAVAVVAAMF